MSYGSWGFQISDECFYLNMEQRTLVKIFCAEELDEAFAELWQ